ncbi:MAG: hypothetical protein QRY72_02965 [Candidatus Rhabdochlamydia sp.]
MSAINPITTSGPSSGLSSPLLADALSKKVNHICSFAKGSELIQMQKELEDLYLEGLKLIAAEVNLRPLTSLVLSEVVTKLNTQLNWEDLASLESKHKDAIHMSLSKTHRVFLELVWFKSIVAQDSLPDDVKQNILNKTAANLKFAPQTYPSTRFEYQCALQAVQVLQTSQNLLDRYASTVINMGINAVTSSFAEALSHLRTFAKNMKTDLSEAWYLDIHHLRWSATTIRSAQDFQAVFSPIQARFEQMGHQYTLGLATTYMDIIRNPDVDHAVQFEAVKRLCQLIELKDESVKASLLKKAAEPTSLEALITYGKTCDKYYATRLLVKEYINHLRSHSKALNLHLDAKINTLEPAIIRESMVAPDELTGLIQEYRSLESYINETEQFIQDTRDILSPAEQQERDMEVKLAQEELQDAYQERAELQEILAKNALLRLAQAELDDSKIFEPSSFMLT